MQCTNTEPAVLLNTRVFEYYQNCALITSYEIKSIMETGHRLKFLYF